MSVRRFVAPSNYSKNSFVFVWLCFFFKYDHLSEENLEDSCSSPDTGVRNCKTGVGPRDGDADVAAAAAAAAVGSTPEENLRNNAGSETAGGFSATAVTAAAPSASTFGVDLERR